MVPLEVTKPSCTCEPVPEVETGVADSGAQSGTVSDSWLMMLSMVTKFFLSKSKSQGQGLSPFTKWISSGISRCF